MRALLFTLVFALFVGCEGPPVHATSDPRQSVSQSHIEGTLVVQSHARGNVAIFLFSTAHPGPPYGTGHPVAFSLVSRTQLFGDDMTGDGPFTAPFILSQIPAGTYTIQALLDHDECLSNGAPGCRTGDFNPFFRVTQEANRGDVGGEAVDAATFQPTQIVVAPGANGVLNVPAGISVSVSDTATFPVDRPAFQLGGDLTYVPSATPQIVDVLPDAFSQQYVDQRFATSFLVQYVDANGDGIPDDANGDGIPDFWPKVLVRKLSDTPGSLNDENDEDNDGVVDSTGASYPRADGSADGKPDAVVLGATLVPTAIIAALTDSEGHPNLAPVQIPALQIALLPVAFDISQGINFPVQLASVPSGRYAVNLVYSTGQTWRVPNELTPGIAEALSFGPDVTQAAVITVP